MANEGGPARANALLHVVHTEASPRQHVCLTRFGWIVSNGAILRAFHLRFEEPDLGVADAAIVAFAETPGRLNRGTTRCAPMSFAPGRRTRAWPVSADGTTRRTHQRD